MSSETSLRLEVQQFKENVDKVLEQLKEDKAQSIKAKRMLFAKFAELWNTAEVAVNADALKELRLAAKTWFKN